MGIKRKRPTIKTKEILGIDVVTEYDGVTLIKEETVQTGVDYLWESLAEKRKKLGADHPDVAQTLYWIGSALMQNGFYGKALFRFYEALRIWEPYGEEKEKELSRCYHRIGYCYFKKKDYKRALAFLQKAKLWRRAVWGEVSFDVCETLTVLGDLYREIGAYERSLLSYIKAAEAMIALRKGEHYRPVEELLVKIAETQVEAGYYDWAIDNYKRAIKNMESRPYHDKKSPRFIALYEGLKKARTLKKEKKQGTKK